MGNLSHIGLGPDIDEPSAGYDMRKPSLAVVAANDKDGVVIWYVGGHLYFEIEEGGMDRLSDLGLIPPSPGLWVWEGRYVWSPGGYECPADGSSDPVGEWREPTADEWVAIKEHRCPWNDLDWRNTQT